MYTYDVQSTMGPQGTDPNATRVITPDVPWSDTWALERVKQDFEFAKTYRSQNHDWRWRNDDEVYLAWYTQKYWEGTRYPRSSLGVYVVLSQVESLIPKVLSTIFAEGVHWFHTDPLPNTSSDEARAVRDLLTYQLDADHTRPHERIREVLRRAVKSSLIYGNGIVEIGWRNWKEKRRRLVRQMVPKKTKIDLGMLGISGSFDVPTGEFSQKIKELSYEDSVSMPFARWVSIKDFYIDPNCPSPNTQEARYCVVRSHVTVDELLRLRETYGFNIPDKKTLVEYANKKYYEQADWTKSGVEVVRTGYWYPQTDMTSDPAGRRCEVLCYWTRDRLVWIVGRERVILNITNPYGFIPFYNCYYVDVPDRFYGLSVTDIVEGDQRLIQSIINARNDELALSIHRPMIKRRGVTIPSYQLRRRPGQIMEAENPKEDIIIEEPKNITQDAYIEVEAAERRVQKATGLTDLAVLGAPSAGGNSASRTATGVNTQAQASFSRIQYIVENLEDSFIEPLLGGIHSLNQRFLDPNTTLQVLGEEGKSVQLDPLSVMNAEVKFAMRASAKFQARGAMLGQIPLILQTFLNPEFMQLLAQQQQKVVNIEELANMLLDTVSYPSRQSMFRKMSQQEMQQQQQPSPEVMAKMQMMKDRMEGQRAMGEEKNMTDLTKVALQKGMEGLGEEEEAAEGE